MKLRLLKLLAERPGQPVVMEALCRELRAEPGQIARAVGQLRNHGFHIDLSPVQGYRYIVSDEPLWKAGLTSSMYQSHNWCQTKWYSASAA